MVVEGQSSESLLLRRPNKEQRSNRALDTISNHATLRKVHFTRLPNVWINRFMYFVFAILCGVLLFHTFAVDMGTYPTRGDVHAKMARRSPTLTVAFVVTITSCVARGGKDPYHVFDGAAVLSYSIHQNSIRGTNGGEYDYVLYAFYHPDAAVCAKPLAKFGYIVQERDTPVALADMENAEVRDSMVKSGCCGEKELIKFEAFTLVQYPIVVLLDVDTLLLKPLDRLFDFILKTTKLPLPEDLMYVGKPAMAGMNTNVTVPKQLDLLYTDDLNMVPVEEEPKGTQGGFVIFRPNQTVYDDIVTIVKKGDFIFGLKPHSGWGGLSGYYHGSLTFQGLMPYYFQILYPGRALAMNWCVWNSAGIPHQDRNNGDKCYSQQKTCENCRARPVASMGLIHMTECCGKPWACYHANSAVDLEYNAICNGFHYRWFKVRSALKKSWGRPGKGTGGYQRDIFLGYCKSDGVQGYERMDFNWSVA
jgi:hypothetical protein